MRFYNSLAAIWVICCAPIETYAADIYPQQTSIVSIESIKESCEFLATDCNWLAEDQKKLFTLLGANIEKIKGKWEEYWTANQQSKQGKIEQPANIDLEKIKQEAKKIFEEQFQGLQATGTNDLYQLLNEIAGGIIDNGEYNLEQNSNEAVVAALNSGMTYCFPPDLFPAFQKLESQIPNTEELNTQIVSYIQEQTYRKEKLEEQTSEQLKKELQEEYERKISSIAPNVPDLQSTMQSVWDEIDQHFFLKSKTDKAELRTWKEKFVQTRQIKISYDPANAQQLLRTILHETGHALQDTYIIYEDLINEARERNAEAISIYFETQALPNYDIKTCMMNPMRISAIFTSIIPVISAAILQVNNKLDDSMVISMNNKRKFNEEPDQYMSRYADPHELMRNTVIEVYKILFPNYWIDTILTQDPWTDYNTLIMSNILDVTNTTTEHIMMDFNADEHNLPLAFVLKTEEQLKGSDLFTKMHALTCNEIGEFDVADLEHIIGWFLSDE